MQPFIIIAGGLLVGWWVSSTNRRLKAIEQHLLQQITEANRLTCQQEQRQCCRRNCK